MSEVVHPAALARMAAIADSGEPPLETLPPHEARRLADLRVTANGLPRPELYEVRDLSAPGPGGPIGLRLYKPSAATDLPLLMFFHGGGFMVANLETHDALCRTLAEATGAAVLAVDYRLAPEHPFPAAPEDCLAATRWALAHAAELRVDASRFALIGESSGGNLAAVTANTLVADGDPRPRLQVMIYGAFDLDTDTPSYRRFETGYFFTKAKAEYFWRHYIAAPEDARDPRAAPLRAPNLEGAPPALIITAGLDPLLSEAEAYAERLRAAGSDVEYRCFEGWPHGFLFWGETEAARDAIAQTAQAVRRALA